MSIGYAGGTNTFLPTFEASGRLTIGFSRNQKDFAVNQVAKLVACDKQTGYYLKFNPLDYNRLPAGGSFRDSLWAPGNPRPRNTMNNLGFEWKEFRCQRSNEHTPLDLLTVNQAPWDIISNHSDALASLAMTKRSKRVYDVMFTSGNYTSSHVATATAIGGGYLNAGTATNPIVKIALDYAKRQILKDTNGNVKPDMLHLVMNPNTAHKISESQEIHSYVKESPFAADMLQAKGSLNAIFNLPEYLYGCKVVVDITTSNDYNRGNSSEAQAFVVPDNYVAVVTREAKFEGSPNTGSFSTVGLFVYSPDDLKVQAFTNEQEELVDLNVKDNVDARMLADVSGFLITNAFS